VQDADGSEHDSGKKRGLKEGAKDKARRACSRDKGCRIGQRAAGGGGCGKKDEDEDEEKDEALAGRPASLGKGRERACEGAVSRAIWALFGRCMRNAVRWRR